VQPRVRQALRQLPRAELAALMSTMLAAWTSAVAGGRAVYEVEVAVAPGAGRGQLCAPSRRRLVPTAPRTSIRIHR
jgi:hypothetical protein